MIDHRPYLRDGDLRTPEDVLAFVYDFVVDPEEANADLRSCVAALREHLKARKS